MAVHWGRPRDDQNADKVSPSVSIRDSNPTTPTLAPARRSRLMMRRFLVGRFYRHRSYWYARVEDLRTGRRFRMSSEETERKKAEAGLKARLGLARHVWDSIVEPSDDDQPITAHIVEDENYHKVVHALNSLEHRAKYAITADDLKAHDEALLSKRDPPRPPSPIFEQAFEEFLQSEKKGVKPETRKDFHYANDRYYLPALSGKAVDKIKHRDIKKLLNQFIGTRKARTHNGHRMTLKSFFAYCVRNEYCEKNPVDGIKRLPEQADEREGKPLTVEQCRSLLRAAQESVERTVKARKGRRKGRSWTQARKQPDWRFLSLLLSLHTGLRQGNVIGKNALVCKEVDLDGGKISIPKSKVKNKRDLEIPIHPELLEVLRARPRGKPNDPVVKGAAKDIDRGWKTVCEIAGVPVGQDGYLWKDLRTTFSTRLVDADIPESVNESLMGHAPGKVVNRRYAKATWEKKVEAIGRLPCLLCEPEAEDGKEEPGE